MVRGLLGRALSLQGRHSQHAARPPVRTTTRAQRPGTTVGTGDGIAETVGISVGGKDWVGAGVVSHTAYMRK